MIYFIKSGDKNKRGQLIKIGFSKNPEKRLAQLQTANPDRLLLVAVLEGNIQAEKDAHEIFKKIHKRGEWFKEANFLKHCLEAYRRAEIKPKNLREFQQAGIELQVRDKLRRYKKKGLKSNNSKKLKEKLGSSAQGGFLGSNQG